MNFELSPVPFKDLKESEFNKLTYVGEEGVVKLMESGDEPYVLREVPLTGSTHEEVEGEVELYKELFEELKEYNIKAPVEFIIGKNDNQDTSLFLATEKINAIDFRNESPELEYDEDIASHLSGSIVGLLDYFVDKIKEGGPMLGDIGRMDQFAFGTSEVSAEKGLFLVDTDPQMTSDSLTAMANLNNISTFFQLSEDKFNIKLPDVLSRLDELINDTELDLKLQLEINKISDLAKRGSVELEYDNLKQKLQQQITHKENK